MKMRKQHTYQIDQSGKIEQTERDSVVALINDKKTTILLKKVEKRKLQEIFKTLGMQKFFPTLTFSVLVALALSDISCRGKVIIDNEYYGHERFIEKHIEIYLELLGVKILPVISFGHVGKLSKAHHDAYLVAMGKEKANLVVNKEEILRILFGTKKSGK